MRPLRRRSRTCACSTTVCARPRLQCRADRIRYPSDANDRASIEFANPFRGTVLDQAWVGYEFVGGSSLLTAAGPATALDPSSCNPLGVPTGAFPDGVNGPMAAVVP